MRDRLEIIRRLLHPRDGSFWVSIDDYEAPYLRILLDEVFGRAAFIASNVWQKRYSRENREAIGDVHEYVRTTARSTSPSGRSRLLCASKSVPASRSVGRGGQGVINRVTLAQEGPHPLSGISPPPTCSPPTAPTPLHGRRRGMCMRRMYPHQTWPWRP